MIIENCYDIAVWLIGELPPQFAFIYPIFTMLIALLFVYVIFLLFKMAFSLVGVR